MASQPSSESEPNQSKVLSLARLSTNEVKPLLGPEPFFHQGEKPGDVAASGVSVLESARLHGPPVVFLGLHEPDSKTGETDVLPSSDFSGKTDPAAVASRLKGTPFFSLDVTRVAQSEVDELFQNAEVTKEGRKLEFVDGRSAMGHLTQIDSAIFSEARSLIDWNSRIKVRASHLTSGCKTIKLIKFHTVLLVLRIPHIFSMGGLEALLFISSSLGRQYGQGSM